MKKTVTLEFNPIDEDIKAFNTQIGAIIWTMWKIDHITNQCFDKEVSVLAEYISNEDPETFDDFLQAFDNAKRSDAFSDVKYPSIHSTTHEHMASEKDKNKFEYWLKQVFDYWKGDSELIIKIDTPELQIKSLLDESPENIETTKPSIG